MRSERLMSDVVLDEDCDVIKLMSNELDKIGRGSVPERVS